MKKLLLFIIKIPLYILAWIILIYMIIIAYRVYNFMNPKKKDFFLSKDYEECKLNIIGVQQLYHNIGNYGGWSQETIKATQEELKLLSNNYSGKCHIGNELYSLKDGYLHGNQIKYYNNKQEKIIVPFVNGAMDGTVIEYSYDGWEKARYNYKNNLRHGIYKFRIKHHKDTEFVRGINSSVSSYAQGKHHGWQVDWEDNVPQFVDYNINDNLVLRITYSDIRKGKDTIYRTNEYTKTVSTEELNKIIEELNKLEETNYEQYRY